MSNDEMPTEELPERPTATLADVSKMLAAGRKTLRDAQKRGDTHRVEMFKPIIANLEARAASLRAEAATPLESVAVPSGPPITREDIVHLRERITRSLDIKDFDWVEVVLASYLSVALVDEQPVCLIIIAPSSAGKTEVIEALHEHPNAPRTHVVGTINANAFLSGKTNPDTGEIDPKFSLLLRKPQIFSLIVKDFTTSMSKNKTAAKELMAALREISDGHYSKDCGTGTLDWRGRMQMILAVTPKIDEFLDAIAELGPRFVFVRLVDRADVDSLMAAIESHGDRTKRGAEIHAAMDEFLHHTFPAGSTIAVPDEFKRPLASLAMWLVTARTVPSRHAKAAPGSSPAEQPWRALRDILTLAKSLAAIRGHAEVEQSDFRTVARITLDTMSPPRKAVLAALRALDKRNPEGSTAYEVAKESTLSESSVRRYLQDFVKVAGALVEVVRVEDEPDRFRIADSANALYSAILSQTT